MFSPGLAKILNQERGVPIKTAIGLKIGGLYSITYTSEAGAGILQMEFTFGGKKIQLFSPSLVVAVANEWERA